MVTREEMLKCLEPNERITFKELECRYRPKSHYQRVGSDCLTDEILRLRYELKNARSKGFVQGQAWGAAVMLRYELSHEEFVDQSGVTLQELKDSEVDEYDAQPIRRYIKWKTDPNRQFKSPDYSWIEPKSGRKTND